jgi:ketosteroid isomerase-like protein
MIRGRLNIALLSALMLLAAFSLSACGDDKNDKSGPTGPTPNTAKLGPIPTGVTGPTKGPKITHTPQAGKYEGDEAEVVSVLDELAVAVNNDDAKKICDELLSEADVKYMNKQGKCYEVIKRLFAYYAGYKIETDEVKVDGDDATANSRMTANQEGKKVTVPNTFVLRKEDGEWKIYIGADKAATEGDDASEF